MNNKLIRQIKQDNPEKWVRPFYEPSITAQVVEFQEECHQTKIIQHANIKIIAGGNGNLNVRFDPVANIHGRQSVIGMREWLTNLPEPRWKNALADIIIMAVDICGNSTKAAEFLGVTRRVINYRVRTKVIKSVAIPRENENEKFTAKM
jgi:hypothetical protein